MYEELINSLRYCATHSCMGEAPALTGCTAIYDDAPKDCDSCNAVLQWQAANAIECLNSQIANEYIVHKAIHRNLSARISRWIPVTERLPEKPENYPHCELRECYFLVTLESTAVVSCGYDFENNRWREFFKVTHWMPLPKPPAVDTEEQP